MSFYSTEGISGNQESSYNGFPAGINKVKFKDFKFAPAKKDGTGDNVITFVFSDNDKNEMDIKMFPLNDKSYELLTTNVLSYDTYIDSKGTKVTKGNILTLQQAKSLALFRFGSRIAEIIYALKEKDEIISGTSYADLAKNINIAVKDNKETEVQLAVQYDSKGYLRIGKQDNSQKFIAHVNGSLAKLKLKLDKPVTVKPDDESDNFMSNKSDTNFDVF